jgi:hypothetical protein
MIISERQPQCRLIKIARFGLSFVAGLLGSLLLVASVWVLMAYTPLSELMALLIPGGEKAAWHLTRATGIVAYLLLTGSAAWGLILSTKIVKERAPAPLALALHSTLSWLSIGVAACHALFLLFDHYYPYTVAALMVPFLGPYRPEWVGLGIVGFYGILVTAASFSARKWIGQKNWRRLHYLTFPVYGFITLHGLMAGTDSTEPGMKAMYMSSSLVVLFLTNYRLLMAARPHPAAVAKSSSKATIR